MAATTAWCLRVRHASVLIDVIVRFCRRSAYIRADHEVRAPLTQLGVSEGTDRSKTYSGSVARNAGRSPGSQASSDAGDGAAPGEPTRLETLTAGDLIRDRALHEATEDQFEHRAIARRISDLLIESEPPINIALFGSWGSGKSTVGLLVREELYRRESKVAFIDYDAWRYWGARTPS